MAEKTASQLKDIAGNSEENIVQYWETTGLLEGLDEKLKKIIADKL